MNQKDPLAMKLRLLRVHPVNQAALVVGDLQIAEVVRRLMIAVVPVLMVAALRMIFKTYKYEI